MKKVNKMYACITTAHWIKPDSPKVRSSFHDTLEKAIEHANNNPGIEMIEKIGDGIVWTEQGEIPSGAKS